MNRIIKKKFPVLYRETPPYRFLLLYRGQWLVIAGYCIVTTETLLATALGLTPISYGDTLLISSAVLSVAMILHAIVRFKKKLLVWQEWSVFAIDLLFYFVFFSVWIYKLGNLRMLGLFSSLIAITIVISYTSLFQSLIMSMPTLLCYSAILFYAISIKGEVVDLSRELFLTCCLVPAYIIIAVVAESMNRHRKKLHHTKKELERANGELHELNTALRQEQAITEIEMELAHDIQSSLFPGKPPLTTDWDIAFISKPKSGVSGDFYDFYCTGEKLDGIALFDVSGHGVASGLITILSKPVLYRKFKDLSSGSLGRVLDAANDELTEQLDGVNVYITGILLRITGNSVEYANAGHPDLYHFQSGEETVRTISDPDGRFRGQPVGIHLNKFHYHSLKFNVAQGDVLIMFSDCVIESRNNYEIQFGRERLSEALREISGMNAGSVLGHILERLYGFTGSESLSDDLTLIVAKKL